MTDKIYKAEEIANFFIDLGIAENNPINPMKLQKIMYFAYGWNWAYFDNKLFDENIQAWKYGPVIEKIYHDVKQYGNYPITSLISKYLYGNGESMFSFKKSTPQLELNKESDKYKFLHTMWQVYSQFSAVQLSNSTHNEGTPWHVTANKYNFNLPLGTKIEDSVIKAYFLEEKKRLEEK